MRLGQRSLRPLTKDPKWGCQKFAAGVPLRVTDGCVRSGAPDRTGEGKGVPAMTVNAVQDIFTAQLDNVGPQAPPGAGVTTVLLRNLIWLHLLATAIAVGCWVHLASRRGVARATVSRVAVGVVAIGLTTAGAGEILGAAMH